MSEGKKKAKKKTKKSARGKAKALSLRQAREEAMAKKKKKKPAKKRKTVRKKMAEVDEAVTSTAESVLEDLQSRVTPASPASPEAAAANIDDPNLAANKAAEAIEATPQEVVKVSAVNAWGVRHHMTMIGSLPANLRRRRYESVLVETRVSDSLYYRNYANVPLDQTELISLMSLLYGKCKEETMAAMAEFYKRFPNIDPDPIDRCIKFRGGEAFIVSQHGLSEMESDPKKLKSTVTKIRNSIVSRIQRCRSLERAMSRESRA